jgi:transcriptional regulator with XRE-family HTH domain
VGETLGELIRQARIQRGWEQDELAQQLGSVGQQTVSRWERGLSRPRPAVIPQLAGLLNVSENQLLAVAGYPSIEAAGPSDNEPPAHALLGTLPFHQLSAEDFENFTADLARHLFPDGEAFRNGEPGYSQEGADVIIRASSGERIYIQCKKVREFGPARVREVVSAMGSGATRCYLYLSRTASPDARKEIARHPGWQIRDARDLSADVRYLPDQDSAARLVETYFGASYRDVFLGAHGHGAWLTPGEYFSAETSGRIYTHGWTLAGRAAELRDLAAFLKDSGQQVAVITGRGGIGKTRLLSEFARKAENEAAAKVRFLARDAAVMPGDFDSLPSGHRAAVVIDDAHNRGRLAGVIRGIRSARPGAKVILSLRPQGLARLRADLREAGLHQSEVPEWRLDDLDFAAAETLAAEALGPHAGGGLPRQLAALAADCPLLITVGGTLISDGHLDPTRLASGAAFREEIITAFRDAITGPDPAAAPGTRQEVLQAIAAVQPFRVDQAAFRSALSGLAGKPFDQLMPHIRHLEEAGVLIRRGNSLRIVPDLLGDVILSEAAADLPHGISTDYLERVLASAESDCLLHLVANASRIDWQIRTGYRTGPSLAESLWPMITSRFRSGGITARLQILDMLRRVAFYQPAAAINLVRLAIADPAPNGERLSPDDRWHPRAAGEQTLEALPTILENTAYNQEHLQEAADLLWELAANDDRPPNQHPEHPIRVLQRLIEYSIAKPVSFHGLLIDAAAGWIRHPRAEDWLYSPFEILKPLLATSVTAFIHNRLELRIRTYPVIPDVVRGLRTRVLGLAFAEARSPDPRWAVEAMQAIGQSIRYEHPADPDEQRKWTPLFVEAIEQIGDLLSGPELDPVVTIAARQALYWHVQYSPTSTKATATTVWNQLPDTALHKLALALHDGWGHLVPHGRNPQEAEHLREAMLTAAAAEAARTWPDDQRLAEQIEERLTVDRRAFPGTSGSSPRPFVWTLARDRPAVALEVCERVTRNPASSLQELIPPVLSQLADALPAEAIRQARRLLSTQNTSVARYVTEAFGFARGNRPVLLEGEEELLRSLLGSAEPDVRRMAVKAAAALASTSPGLAIELLTTVDITDPDTAETLAAAFGPYGGLSWADLPETQAEQILRQLSRCPTIESYEIACLLAEIAKEHPERVLDLLKDRITTWEKMPARAGYLPIPHIWHVRPDFRVHDRYPALLRDIRDWIAEGVTSPARRTMGAQIFAVIAGPYDEEARATLIEAVESEENAQVKAVGAILREAPSELAWDLSFVRHALHAAARHGAEYAKSISSGLLQAAINGTLPIPLGQPATDHAGQPDKLTAILHNVPPGSPEASFYQSLAIWTQKVKHLDDPLEDELPDGRHW